MMLVRFLICNSPQWQCSLFMCVSLVGTDMPQPYNMVIAMYIYGVHDHVTVMHSKCCITTLQKCQSSRVCNVEGIVVKVRDIAF